MFTPKTNGDEIVTLHNGAILFRGDGVSVLEGLEDSSVALIATDPPYGTQVLAGGYGRRQKYDIGDGLGRVIQNDTDLSAISSAYKHFKRVVGTGYAEVFCSAKLFPKFLEATSADDWLGEIIWDKKQPGLGFTIRYSHESVAVFEYGDPPTPKDAALSVIRAYQLSKDHPHEKPVPVMKALISWCTRPGDLVVDPFMGSGTTGVAAIELGRRFIGVEIDQEFFSMAVARVSKAVPEFTSIIDNVQGTLF